MAFAWMVARASWRATRVRYKGRAVMLNRGELCISQRDMAEAFDRDKAWIERLWKRLVLEAMIEARREAAAMVITICNYDKYQQSCDEREAVNEAREEIDLRQTQGRREAQNKEGNKGKEVIRDDANASSATKRGSRLSDDWLPSPVYPDSVAVLVVQWPPGRADRELEQFRGYWTTLTGKAATKLDWDKTWHNRIRDQHDRIMRESRNDQRNGQSASGFGRTVDALADFVREAEDGDAGRLR